MLFELFAIYDLFADVLQKHEVLAGMCMSFGVFASRFLLKDMPNYFQIKTALR
jgi:hypothetical protein